MLVVTAGQANDSPMLPGLLEGLRMPRLGPGPPRTRHVAVLADTAHSSRAHRARSKPPVSPRSSPNRPTSSATAAKLHAAITWCRHIGETP